MKNLILSALLAMMVLGTTAEIAVAADDPPPSTPASVAEPAVVPPSLDLNSISEAYRAIVDGDWWIAAGIGLSLVVLVLRRYGTTGLPIVGWRILPSWFATDRGGVVLVLVLSVFGSLGHAFAADADITLATFEAAVLSAVAAIGGYSALRKLFLPSDKGSGPGGGA